jgi:hypothetical protein
MQNINRLLDRLDKLEERIRPGEKRYPEWMGTRFGALLALRTIAEMRWLSLRNSALTHAVQGAVMAQVAAVDCLEAAKTVVDELLDFWRRSDVKPTPTEEQNDYGH